MAKQKAMPGSSISRTTPSVRTEEIEGRNCGTRKGFCMETSGRVACGSPLVSGKGFHLLAQFVELGFQGVDLGRRLAIVRIGRLDGGLAQIGDEGVEHGHGALDKMRKKQMRKSMAESFGEMRSEEHTSELPYIMRSSYAGFCLKK